MSKIFFLCVVVLLSSCATKNGMRIANEQTPNRDVATMYMGTVSLANAKASKRLNEGDFTLDFSNCKKSTYNIEDNFRRVCLIQVPHQMDELFAPQENLFLGNELKVHYELNKRNAKLTFNIDWFDAASDAQITAEITKLFQTYQTARPSRYSADGAKLKIRGVTYISSF